MITPNGDNHSEGSSSDDNNAGIIYEDPVIKILRGFRDVSSETVRKIVSSGITYIDLSSLVDEDLKLFGVQNPLTRAEIVSKLENCPNQRITFEKYTSDLDKTKYKENVLKKLRDHLRRINVILSVSEVSHQAKPIERDMLIDGNVYFSTLNRKALEAIKDLAENSLGELKSSNKNWLYMFTIGLAVAGSFMIFR